jgi:3'(2'), 5'-bisphosphate nucleotidase
MSYEKELRIAQLAVQRAALLTKRVFRETSKGTLSKDDSSPVTIGDFGAQALVIHALQRIFPEDEIVAEEEAGALRVNKSLTDQIWALVKESRLEDHEAEEELGGPLSDVDQMLEAIDAGKSSGGAKGRIWALDPIDGTQGFLRGGQYAVCLALIEDGDIKVGVLGCPNLPVDNNAPLPSSIGGNGGVPDGNGVIFSAALGCGAWSRPLGHGGLLERQPIHVNPLTDITQASFCESFEPAHSSHGHQAAIAAELGITRPSVRMDSQAKYGSVARGAGDLYLRIPVSLTYQEKIWDHAAGVLIVKEAGGEVTDVQGKRLDFSRGRTLSGNRGFVVTPRQLHAQVLKVVKSVLDSKD